jgi:hypothetical protein
MLRLFPRYIGNWNINKSSGEPKRAALSEANSIERRSISNIKGIGGMSSYKPLYKPLLKRPADAFYFLGSHLAASLLLDAQALLPKTWFPLFFRETLTWFLTSTNDPLFRNGPQPWLKSFLWCELCIQCPVFVAGMIGLAKGVCMSHEIST